MVGGDMQTAKKIEDLSTKVDKLTRAIQEQENSNPANQTAKKLQVPRLCRVCYLLKLLLLCHQ